MKLISRWFLLVLLNSLCLSIFAASYPVTPTSMFKTQTVQYVQVSPDGKAIVYQTTAFAIVNQKGIKLSRLWLTKHGQASHLLLPNIKTSVVYAKWSPDGQWISYVNKDSDNGSVWLVHPDGSDNHRLVDLPPNCDDIEWSPNGKIIALRADSIYNLDPTKGVDAPKLHPLPRIYLIFLTESNQPQVAKFVPLTALSYGAGGDNFIWTADSQNIIFNKAVGDDFASYYQRQLAEININTGKLTLLQTAPARYDTPFVSPDGQWLVYASNQTNAKDLNDLSTNKAYAAKLLVQACVLSLRNGKQFCLPDYYDGYASIVGWSADSQSILINQDYHTLMRLISVPISGTTIKVISKDLIVRDPHITANGRYVGFSGESPTVAPEAFRSEIANFQPQQMSHINDGLHPMLGKTVVISWRGGQGDTVEGLLTYPVNYQPGHPVPLIVALHGGPNNHWWQDYIGLPHISMCTACLANQGYAVLRPNVHGSSGYGRTFVLSNYKKIGEIDFQDIMLGIDNLIQKKIVKADCLGVWGWSYGGFLSSWTIEHTTRFKAAVVGAGISDFISKDGTAIYPIGRYYFGSEFWKQPLVWLEHSPIMHVRAIRTPILIQGGDADVEVPLSQSFELYHALLNAHKFVRFIVYPHQPHVFTDPAMIVAAAENTQNWFETYVCGMTHHRILQ